MVSDLLHPRRNMDWKNDVIPKVLQKLQYEYTFAPTVRGMFYNLASDGVISNTTERFERMALTKRQIKDFALEHLKNPDPDVLKKLQRDQNSNSFIQENGDLFQIEIDALQRDPEKYKNLVLSAVDRYFDQRVYDAVMTEYTPQDIEKLVHEQVQFNDGVGGF